MASFLCVLFICRFTVLHLFHWRTFVLSAWAACHWACLVAVPTLQWRSWQWTSKCKTPQFDMAALQALVNALREELVIRTFHTLHTLHTFHSLHTMHALPHCYPNLLFLPGLQVWTLCRAGSSSSEHSTGSKKGYQKLARTTEQDFWSRYIRKSHTTSSLFLAIVVLRCSRSWQL